MRCGVAMVASMASQPQISWRAIFTWMMPISRLLAIGGVIITVSALPFNYVPFGFLAPFWKIFRRLHQGLWHSLDANSVLKTPAFFRTIA